MRPFLIRLAHKGRHWLEVRFGLGHDEIAGHDEIGSTEPRPPRPLHTRPGPQASLSLGGLTGLMLLA